VPVGVSWAPFRTTKAAVKMHTLLDLRGNIPSFIHISDGKLHDVMPSTFWCRKPGPSTSWIVATSISSDCMRPASGRCFFVTRAKSNMNSIVSIRLPTDRSTGIICDQTIALDGFYTSRTTRPSAPHPLQGPETGKTLVFLTNNFDLAGHDHLRALQEPLAGRTVLQVDQAASSDQTFLRYVGECGQVANLDRRVGLCPRRHRQEAPQSRRLALHFATDFVGHPFRENALAASLLLSLARKRTIPQFPRSIGIITSPQAAALRDVLSTITARWPGCGVILYPTPVQGDSAARGLIEAISTAGLRRECDVLLLVRGGGSLEDLLGFNDESVARAIVACPIPIVSGVGHETDFTIADFVADLRAPTPTGAAQLATPSRIDIRLHIQHLNTRLYQIQQSKFHALSQQLDGLRRRVTHPRDRIAFRRQQIRHLTWRLNIAMKAGVDSGASRLARCKRVSVTIARDSQSYRERVITHERRLHAAMHKLIEDRGQSVRVFLSHLELLSPSSVLRRGYSIVLNERREVLRDAAEVVIGQHLEIRLAQGALGAEVVRIEDSNN
jgi:exodeoxyribonuclease VII large subunit